MTIVIAFLKTFWKELLALGLIVGAVWTVWSAIDRYGEEQYEAGYSTREAEYVAARDKAKDDHIEELARQQRVSNEIVTDLQSKLDAIDDRPPGEPVWMCKQPASVPRAPGSETSSGPRGVDEGSQGQPPQQVRDIGPGTRAILDDGDSAIEELTALQGWVRRNCLRPASPSK